MRKLPSLLIITAGILWGAMGLFTRTLTNTYHFTSIQTAALRLSSAAILFIVFTLLKDRHKFKIAPKDVFLFMVLGFGSVLLMTVTYFISISLSSLSVAAILLYTAPIFVMIMSSLFFREKINKRKVISILLAFLGCVLVSGIASGDVNVLASGLFFGIASAVFYASYSIVGTFALRKYHPYTVTTWAFIFAALGSLFICNLGDALHKIASAPDTLMLTLWILGTGLFTAFLPFLLYTIGLMKTEPSRAAVMASTEPLSATVVGFMFFRETPDVFSVLGILTIILAIMVLNNFGRK